MTKKLELLRAKRQQHLNALGRICEFVKDVQESPEQDAIFSLDSRLHALPALSKQFEDTQVEIEVLADNLEEETNCRVEFENKYHETYSSITKLIQQLKAPVVEFRSALAPEALSKPIQQGPPAVHLPLMNLPKFNGEYDRWLEFRDSFVALVDGNPNIANIQKFIHLRSCLGKDVLETISAIPVCEQNYPLAWQQLTNRYQKNHLIAKYHVSLLMKFPTVTKPSSQDLRSLYNCVNNNIASLKNLGVPVQTWDLILFHIIGEKLDPITAKEWETLTIQRENVTLDDLLTLINNRCDLLERLEVAKGISKHSHTNSPAGKVSKIGRSSDVCHVQTTTNDCKMCNGNHPIFKCPTFLQLEVGDRFKAAKEKGLCLNCLKSGHLVTQCRSSKCRNCGKAHNSLLHKKPEDKTEQHSSPQPTESTTAATTQTQVIPYNRKVDQVVLPTTIIFVRDKQNKVHRCRALLDSGAMSNFISKDLCDRLGLQKIRINCSISGVGQVVQKSEYAASIKFKSIQGGIFHTQCIVLDRITSDLPLISFDKRRFQLPGNLVLADPTFHQSSPIDILLGSSIFWDILQPGRLQIPNTGLSLQETKLGWIVGGCLAKRYRNLYQIEKRVDCLSTTHVSLEEQIAKFWEVEEMATEIPMSAEDSYCEKLFTNTHRRGEDGRFIVKIPFKPTLTQLGHSRASALKRFELLERKFSRNKELYNEYVKIMAEYQMMGHMKRIQEDQDEDDKASYYIPHHAVIRQESLTTKIRVVFDASMKSSTGLSLNDVQYVGPSIQNELFSTLINFRLHKYVLSSDISKMYRMIELDDGHKQFHRIFWRENPREPMQCFELQRVTFGTASAPFLALRCLKQLAIEFETRYPKASQIIANNFYVDDLIYGAETISELVQLQHQISSILSSAGFHLRKWLGNSEQIYAQLTLTPNLDCNTLQFGDKSNKTLGISWHSTHDEISYRGIQFNNSTILTKRMILSDLAKIFDPLGLLGPLLVVGKLLMQELWKLPMAWDHPVPEDISTKWHAFRKEISDLHSIQIPRRVLVDNYSHVEFHGFCDASERAYGACIFVKSLNADGDILTRLLCSKSRVAPLKQISLPRLELCGALLLSRLIQKVKQKFEVPIGNIRCWSDSTITLAWIRNEPRRWKSFVANRVSEIQTLTDAKNWHHVSSSENPCDILSRGATVNQLINHEIWWSGPNLIRDELICDIPDVDMEDLPEERTLAYVSAVPLQVEIIDRYSSFKRLVRIAACCFRFLNNCKAAVGKRTNGDLTAEELRDSETKLIRSMQIHSFSNEYQNLKSCRALNSKSKILSLNPFLDQDGLIRVGGRIQKSNLSPDTKHPIILDPKHRLTKLIVQHIHFENLHCGPSLLLSFVRQKYWPLNGRNLVRGITRKCTVCFLAKPRAGSYIMGQLPKARVVQSFPFQTVGIDYAGPILIKDRKTRNPKLLKSYICLFVCLVTKAIHLECVTELTTEGFIACLNRFISRRGKPSQIYSDNGKNFVGANAEIKRFYKFVSDHKSQLSKFFVDQQIRWHFTPARSPSFGGIWEAGIKSVKYHLIRTMKNNKFDYEELSTVLCQIEAVLNSRPLTPITSDPTDLNPLTPAHFLIGRTFVEHPETTSVSTLPASRLRRYEHLPTMLQHFWNRWSRQYITELQGRTKWKRSPEEPTAIQVGKVVLVKDDEYPPFQWPLGRITEVHPGSDGVIRVVSVKLRDSVVKRAVGKICVLPEDSV